MTETHPRKYGNDKYHSLYGCEEHTEFMLNLEKKVPKDCWCRCLYCLDRRGERKFDDPLSDSDREIMRRTGDGKGNHQ